MMAQQEAATIGLTSRLTPEACISKLVAVLKEEISRLGPKEAKQATSRSSAASLP